jgi:hypothetical protein
MGKIEHRHGHFTSKAEAVLQKIVRKAGGAIVIANGKITGYRLRDGSMVCRKRRYRDKLAADVDLARIAHISHRAHIPVRSYHCPDCLGYHLTSTA